MIEHKDVTSVHRIGFVGASDPGSIGAYIGWINTSTVPSTLYVRNASNTGWLKVGEQDSFTNIGTGASVFKQKTGESVEFRRVRADNNKVSVTENTNDISVGVNEANLSPININGYAVNLYSFSQSGTDIIVHDLYEQGPPMTSFTRRGEGNYTVTFAESLPVGRTIITCSYGYYPSGPNVDTVGIFITAYRSIYGEIYITSYNIAGIPTDLDVSAASLVVYIIN